MYKYKLTDNRVWKGVRGEGVVGGGWMKGVSIGGGV